MKTKHTNLVKKADLLFSKYIRLRGVCERCGVDDAKKLQCAHVINRTHKGLRYNEDNALCLCIKCHLFWAHRSPLEFTDWFKTHFPIRYAFLMREKDRLSYQLGSSLEDIVKGLEYKLLTEKSDGK